MVSEGSTSRMISASLTGKSKPEMDSVPILDIEMGKSVVVRKLLALVDESLFIDRDG